MFPDVIRIESSGLCNFACKHCPNGQKKLKRKNLSLELFTHLVNQLISLNIVPRVAVLYHGGEPLLNPHLSSMIRRLKEIGVQYVKITTNTSTLTPKKAIELTHSGLDGMDVSYDGESPEENNFIRSNANFDKDSQNLINFLKINDTTEVRISNVRVCSRQEISNYRTTGNLDIPQYLHDRFGKFKNVTFTSFPAMIWPDNAYKHPWKEIEFTSQSNKKVTCKNYIETINILSNGDVVPCCYDITGKVILGNIKDDNIINIRNSITSERFYNSFLDGQRLFPLCKQCLHFRERYLVKDEPK